MSPDGGAQIGSVEGGIVPDLYTFSYDIQRKPIRNIRISEPERALRSQVGAPGGELFGEIEQRLFYPSEGPFKFHHIFRQYFLRN